MSTLDAPPHPWEAQQPPTVGMSTRLPDAPGASVMPRAINRMSAYVITYERPVDCTWLSVDVRLRFSFQVFVMF